MRCTPAAAIVTLVAPEVAARPDLRTEPIYGTKYATVPMGAEVAAWERATRTYCSTRSAQHGESTAHHEKPALSADEHSRVQSRRRERRTN